jgi:hypothetical protein
MVARIGCELVPNSGPALIVDQGRLLTGVEFTLVSYVADHLRKVRIVLQRCAGRRGVTRPGVYLSSSLTCQQPALLGPVQRQIEFGQTRRGELDGLPALHDRLDQRGA